MYTFLLRYYNIETDTTGEITIKIDSTPIECSEREIYICAMEHAYIYCVNNHVEFDTLEFISC